MFRDRGSMEVALVGLGGQSQCVVWTPTHEGGQKQEGMAVGTEGEQIQEEGCIQPEHRHGMEWLGESMGPSVTPGSGLRCKADCGVFPEVMHLGEKQI